MNKHLTLGSRGAAVKALQSELKNQGFYTGAVNGYYSKAVESAVELSQFAKLIMADGEAGSATFKALGISQSKSSTSKRKPISLKKKGIERASLLWGRGSRKKAKKHLLEGFKCIEPYKDRLHLSSTAEIALFLGQVRQETGYNFKLEENLNYRYSALKKIFSYYRRNPHQAFNHGRRSGKPANQEAIANHAYGDRTALGNKGIGSGDGWLYKGAGLGHLTGRGNYLSYQGWLKRTMPSVYTEYQGDKIMTEGFKAVSESPHAFLSFVYFWSSRGLYKGAKYGVTKRASDYVTKIVNRSTTSYSERWKYTKKAEQLISSS